MTAAVLCECKEHFQDHNHHNALIVQYIVTPQALQRRIESRLQKLLAEWFVAFRHRQFPQCDKLLPVMNVGPML